MTRGAVAMAAAGLRVQPIRVLIIDDSAVARAIFTRILQPCVDLLVVGEAASAPQAIRMLADLAVDVILLDLELPQIGGLDALPDLLARARSARVLVVSSSCGEGAEAGVRALRLGAADTLPKPDGRLLANEFATALVERVRRLGSSDRPAAAGPLVPMPTSTAPSPPSAMPDVPEAIGIAASTGGVHALIQLLAALPDEMSVPLCITQHLPPSFIEPFAGQLAEASGRTVRVAAAGMQPRPGEILLAPGDRHLTLVRTGEVHVRLEQGRSASGCLPSADPMFRALAQLYGARAVGVVLSGMGRDGAEGAAAIVEAGGHVIAQDQATSVVWGMPGTVARRGLARAVLPPVGLAGWLARLGRGEAQSWS